MPSKFLICGLISLPPCLSSPGRHQEKPGSRHGTSEKASRLVIRLAARERKRVGEVPPSWFPILPLDVENLTELGRFNLPKPEDL